jgi:hypothetical protein
MSTVHDIPLTASLAGSKVSIKGDGARDLPTGSGAHRFKFALTDQTGLNVQFSHLDSEDNSSSCPPASGENSRQIVGVTIGPHAGTASFTDNNNNQGEMFVSYQWNFTCDHPTVQVEPFDPMIRNGGISH